MRHPAACMLTPLPLTPMPDSGCFAGCRASARAEVQSAPHARTHVLTCPCREKKETSADVCRAPPHAAGRVLLGQNALTHLQPPRRHSPPTRTLGHWGRSAAQKCRTALKSSCRVGRRRRITNAESLCQRWHQQKQPYHAVAAQLVLVYRVQTKPIMPGGAVLHVEHNGSLSFDECS